MSTADSKEFLLKEFEKLDEEGQKKILDYVKRLSRRRNSNINNILKLAGSIDAEELKLMDKAIKEGCEEVDHNEW